MSSCQHGIHLTVIMYVCTKRHEYECANRIIYSCQELEITQMSINGTIGTENMLHPHLHKQISPVISK